MFSALRPVLRACLACGPALLVWGCNDTEPTKPGSVADARRIVLLCSGGMSQTLSAKVEAAYTETGAVASAAFANKVEGLILADPTLSGAEKERVHRTFFECINQRDRAVR